VDRQPSELLAIAKGKLVLAKEQLKALIFYGRLKGSKPAPARPGIAGAGFCVLWPLEQFPLKLIWGLRNVVAARVSPPGTIDAVLFSFPYSVIPNSRDAQAPGSI